MAELRELGGSRDVPADVALRAWIVLWSGEGRQRKDIAELAGVAPLTVDRCKARYAERCLAGFEEKRRGGPRTQVTSDASATAPPMGTTDDPRIRRLTQLLPPQHVRSMWDAYEAGDERALEQAMAEGLGEVYFRDGGRRAHGLEVSITELEHVEVDWT
ncbi:hypothetical protein ACFV2D_37275 [Streptomyces capillispiralis]|uniref:hypothetical protein n=1 Tax=Streptomyces capillispiralis TaxID=68182 RepID=UPI0036C51FE0